MVIGQCIIKWTQGVVAHIQFIGGKLAILLERLFVVSLIIDEVYFDIIKFGKPFPDHNHVSFLCFQYRVAPSHIPLNIGV